MRNWKLWLPLALALVLAFVMERSRPRPLNWTPTFAATDKIPFGTYALFQGLPDLFPGQPIRQQPRPLFNWKGRDESYRNHNLIFITAFFNPGKLDGLRLMHMVRKGAVLFVSGINFNPALKDSLGFQMGYRPKFSGMDSVLLPPFNDSGQALRFKSGSIPRYFDKFDSSAFETLAVDSAGKAIFITRSWGKGRIYLHCLPLIFTNYNFLKAGMPRYVAATLSSLPVQPVEWDAYYKAHLDGKMESPLRYILNDPVLGPVYYLAWAGVLLFVLVNGRRRQRAVPIVGPPKNESLSYLKTLADLYRQGENRLSAARIRRRFVLAFIRERFHLETRTLDKRFSEMLRQKSNLSRLTVNQLVHHLRSLDRMRRMDKMQFKTFNDWVEKFYHELENLKNAGKEQGNGVKR